ncbi:MAG: helix-turn-helix domain-containing protein [Pseudomonadota bacterium]|nr:helix-turn-helix domain-containing protein [Pseudomonadota bacterium]
MEVLIAGRRYIPAPAVELNGSMGQKLCVAREHAGYSLSAAAGLLGMSKAQLWELEAGRQTNPTLKTMLALMRCYGLKADVFFTPNAQAQPRPCSREAAEGTSDAAPGWAQEGDK